MAIRFEPMSAGEVMRSTARDVRVQAKQFRWSPLVLIPILQIRG